MTKTKSNPVWFSLLESVTLSCITYIGFHLLLAFCIVKGIIPEHHAVTYLAILCGLCSLLGAIFAIRKISGLNGFAKSLLSTFCFCIVLLLCGLAFYGKITFKGSGGVLLCAALLGGICANIFIKTKKGSRMRRHN